jgi:hypothetical protein
MSANSIHFIPEKVQVNRGVVFCLLVITALLAFEIFNFSNTVFAFTDLLGDLRFWGVRWATILAITFCRIVFQGLLDYSLRMPHLVSIRRYSICLVPGLSLPP